MSTELSEKTTIKLPLPLAISIIIGLILFGGTYTTLISTSSELEALKKVVAANERMDREEREKIRKEEADKHKEMTEWVMQYLRDEVGGLRSDWDRNRIETNRRLELVEIYYFQNFKK